MKILVTDPKAFQTEIARLNKRAARIGVPLITASLLRHTVVEQTRVVILTEDGDKSENTRVVPVDVAEYELTLPSMDEYKWTLQATITPLEGGGSFIDKHQKDFDIKPWEGVNPGRCQHCNISRLRNLTYVVQNKEDGSQLQVGKTCFADYVGQKGLMALEFQALLFSVFSMDGEYPPERGARGAVECTDVKKAIALAELLAKNGGWKNNKYDECGELLEPGTHRIAAAILRNRGGASAKELMPLNDPTHIVHAEVNEIVAKLQDMELAADDEFGHAIQYCLQYELVPTRKAGLVAYAGEFLRNRAARKLLEEKKATMTYVGTVGKREVFENLTCTKVHSFETQYGWQNIHIFTDPAGNQLVWKTGNDAAKVGEVVSFKATVKEHSEYNGVKQTIVTRAALLRPPSHATLGENPCQCKHCIKLVPLPAGA